MPSSGLLPPARPSYAVVTGGPGAGKTAVLEVVRRQLGPQVVVLPEAAGIVFGGGFPRRTDVVGRQAAQGAIFHVQRHLERLCEHDSARVVLCDRGTVDGVAYWPGPAADFYRDVSATAETELARYALVIHLRTPPANGGYNHANPLRTESASEAAAIDQRIAAAWAAHPRRFVIEATPDFVEKVQRVLGLLRAELTASSRS